MKINPFLISGYVSPEFFCNRIEETETIINAIRNGRHLTIFSPRRIGKTGLIKHVFHIAREKKYVVPVYTDILATSSIKEFTECFGKALLTEMAKTEPVTKRILRTLSTLRPRLGIDPLTGEPSLSFAVGNDREAVDSLDLLFRYLKEQKNHFALAIDEFQQVSSYPEKNLEAILRAHLQETTNATLIFSGSRKHILTQIFSTPDRPFYNSTQMMEIGKIRTDDYKSFISERFERHKAKVEPDAVDHILKLTASHTFYVQYMCNRLFSTGVQINKERVDQMLLKIITENEAVYASYINLLTPLQFRILRAVALNGGIQNPTSGEFISRYGLGAASSVSLAIKSLIDKEFVALIDSTYVLNDLFFDNWLRYRGNFN